MEDPRGARLRWWEALFRVRTSPTQLALGLAVGWLFGYLPKSFLTPWLIAVIPIIAPANLITFAFSSLIGFYFSPVIDPNAQAIAESMSQSTHIVHSLQWLHTKPFLAWLGLNHSLIVGGCALALPVSPVLFIVSERVFAAIRYVFHQHAIDRMLSSLVPYRRKLINQLYQRTSHESQTNQSISQQFVIGEPESIQSPFTDEVERWLTLENAEHRIDVAHDASSTPALERSGLSLEREASTTSDPDKDTELTIHRPLSAWRNDNMQSAMAELRVDAAHPTDPHSVVLAPVSSTLEHATVHSHSQTSLKVGDVIRETLIDIVRIKPQEKPMSMVSHSNSTSTLPVVETPTVIPATHDSHPSQPPIALTASTSRERAPQEIVPEECLRHLLWHLQGTKRESK